MTGHVSREKRRAPLGYKIIQTQQPASILCFHCLPYLRYDSRNVRELTVMSTSHPCQLEPPSIPLTLPLTSTFYFGTGMSVKFPHPSDSLIDTLRGRLAIASSPTSDAEKKFEYPP